MNYEKYIRMIDEYLTEPHSINKEWVELLQYARELFYSKIINK